MKRKLGVVKCFLVLMGCGLAGLVSANENPAKNWMKFELFNRPQSLISGLLHHARCQRIWERGVHKTEGF